MKKKELIEKLSQLDIDDDAEVVVITDHGQDPECISMVEVSTAFQYRPGHIELVSKEDFEEDEITKAVVIYGQ